MCVRLIRENFPNVIVEYLFHEGRQHGLTNEVMEVLRNDLPDLLILPDSSSNDVEQHSELKSLGVPVLILDHHSVEKISKDAVVISNNELISPDYHNRELSGAGIVLKFIEALSEELQIEDIESYYSLAAVGIVADMMPIMHPETRYYVYKGLKDVQNPFIRQLIYKNAGYALKQAYPKIVSWNISNYMNAIVRMGKPEDKETMFRAMLGEKEILERISKYRGVSKEVSEELHETAYRLSANARNRQNTLKKKLILEAVAQIEETDTSNDAALLVTFDDLKDGFSGFIAGDLASTYKKPVVVVSWNKAQDKYTGSGRGIDSVMLDTRKYMDGLDVFEFCSGHPQAFGVAIAEDNLESVYKAIKGSPDDAPESLEVDFTIDSTRLAEPLIKEFFHYDYLWCKGFDEPLVAVENVTLNCKYITFGNTMKFEINGVEILAFQIDGRLQELAEQGKSIKCTLIGTVGINYFLGKETPQLKLEEIEIKEVFTPENFGFEF